MSDTLQYLWLCYIDFDFDDDFLICHGPIERVLVSSYIPVGINL